MSLWKPALAGALLAPLMFAASGGVWCHLTQPCSSPAVYTAWGMILLPLTPAAPWPACVGTLIHVLTRRTVSWATCPTASVLLASGISMLAWNVATTPLRFALSLRTSVQAVRDEGGKPEKVPTDWIFIGATATGAAWGVVGGARGCIRLSDRKGILTPDMALAVAVVCGALAIGVHVLFFGGPFYGRRFDT